MEINTTYQFQRIGEEHIPAITKLHRLVFNSDIEEQELRSIFDTRLFGKYTIGFLALANDGEVAAYYGVFPIIGKRGNSSVLIAQSGATMTHPNHQKKGLFVALAKLTFEAASEEGVEFIYGFPNENSLPGFQNKLNWKFQGSLQKVVLRTGALPFCELASKNFLVNKLYRSILKWRTSQLKISTQKVSFKDTSVAHSNEFLEYKLRNGIVQLIQLNGIDFLVKSSPHLLVGDVQFNRTMTPAEFKLSLIQLGKIFMASKVVLQFTRNHWITAYLETEAILESLPVGVLSFEKDGESVLEFNYSDLDTF